MATAVKPKTGEGKKAVSVQKPAKKAAPVATDAAPVASTFTLRNDVALPATVRGGGADVKYPFGQMTAGQSFEVAVEAADPALYTSPDEATQVTLEQKRKVSARLSGAVRRFVKANPNSGKFAVRTTDGGVGVWRTE